MIQGNEILPTLNPSNTATVIATESNPTIMISEPNNVSPKFSKTKKATPPSGRKKAKLKQQHISPKLAPKLASKKSPVYPKLTPSTPSKELPAGVAEAVISIENQNLLSQIGKLNHETVSSKFHH